MISISKRIFQYKCTITLLVLRHTDFYSVECDSLLGHDMNIDMKTNNRFMIVLKVNINRLLKIF